MNWWKSLKGKVRLNEPLKKHATLKIGGPAKFFIEPQDIADLQLCLRLAKRNKVPTLIIGSGSNLLVSDRGISSAVLSLSASFFKQVSFSSGYCQVGSGVSLSRVLDFSLRQGLSGAEFLAGIPGTIGGALAMNAGIPGRCIADIVKKVEVMDYHGKISLLQKEDIRFGYRYSSLAKYIILRAYLRLKKKSPLEIRCGINQYKAYRRDNQDNSLPNAGCIFKNPGGESAGRLIDLCGLKGQEEGGASVSLRHANFILNSGRASSNDVLRLMALIKRRVRERFHLVLEPEIKIWR